MRIAPLLLGLAVAGCTAGVDTIGAIGAPRPEVLRDAEGYAIASCLAHQTHLYLKDQGDAWASAIVQRGKGPVEHLFAIDDAVKNEIAKGRMAVIRAETGTEKDKTAPVLYCGEIIDAPSVRAEIQNAITKLDSFYGKQKTADSKNPE